MPLANDNSPPPGAVSPLIVSTFAAKSSSSQYPILSSPDSART